MVVVICQLVYGWVCMIKQAFSSFLYLFHLTFLLFFINVLVENEFFSSFLSQLIIFCLSSLNFLCIWIPIHLPTALNLLNYFIVNKVSPSVAMKIVANSFHHNLSFFTLKEPQMVARQLQIVESEGSGRRLMISCSSARG